MEARNRSLPDWLTRIRTRQIALPRFQRFEAWSHSQVENLLNTVLQGLPSGALLTLEVGMEEKFVSRPIVTAPEQGEKIVEHLLDGQQRLTALWRSLNNTYADRLFLIKLDDSKSVANAQAVSVATYEKKGQRYPLWASNPAELWRKRLVPAFLLLPGQEQESRANDWAKQAVEGEGFDPMLALISVITQLRSKVATYNIPFLSLPASTEPEVALNVFIQMNTSSSPLTSFDIVVAQVEAVTGNSLHGYIEELRTEAPTSQRYGTLDETVLAVAALLSDSVPSRGTYLSKEFASNFEANWDAIKVGVKKTLAFLSDEKIFDEKRLPTEVVVYVMSALWAIAPDGLDREGKVRHLIKKYMWRSFFTERYDRTTNTRAFADFKELRKLIAGEEGKPEIFDESVYPVANSDDLLSAAWPSRKDRLARAILALSLKGGGLDFADGAPASYDSIQNREYHHIFPKSWLEKSGYRDHEINRAINCALISWKTNRNISAKAPSEYVAERMEKSSLGDVEVRARLESHLISTKLLEANNYVEFVSERATFISQQARDLCEGL